MPAALPLATRSPQPKHAFRSSAIPYDLERDGSGYLSYAQWGTVSNPSEKDFFLHVTDQNFCNRGRKVSRGEKTSPDVREAFETLVKKADGLPQKVRLWWIDQPKDWTSESYANPNYPAFCDPSLRPPLPLHSMDYPFWSIDCRGEDTDYMESFVDGGPERDRYEIYANGNRLYWKRGGSNHKANEPVNVATKSVVSSKGVRYDKRPDYIVSADRRIFLCDWDSDHSGKAHHSMFLSGGAVLLAGTMLVTDGVVTSRDFFTGHYALTSNQSNVLTYLPAPLQLADSASMWSNRQKAKGPPHSFAAAVAAFRPWRVHSAWSADPQERVC